MKRVHYLTSAALFPALLSITAYSENDGDTISRTATLADPCAVALAPHSGSDTIDRTIVQLQGKSRQAIKPLIPLERLGWAFVTKARASFDTGYYRLAEQTALCMASKQADSGRNAELSAWINTRLALYEMQAGRLAQASRYLDRTLEQHPDYAPALLGRGRLLLAGAQYREAIVPLTRAVALSPLPETRWTLIEALRAAGNEVEAQKAATRLGERGAIDDARTYALYLATTGTRHAA